MFKNGSQVAGRAGITAFALGFLLCVFMGVGVAGACLRGAAVAAAVFVSVRVIHYLFVRAVVDELAEFACKDGVRNKSTVK